MRALKASVTVLLLAGAAAATLPSCAPHAEPHRRLVATGAADPTSGAAESIAAHEAMARATAEQAWQEAQARTRSQPRATRGSSGRTRLAPRGGSLPPDSVRQCESKGDYSAQNRHSSASGGWQITDGSWGGYGGYTHAKDAPPDVQDARAAELWAGGAGANNWRACL